MIRRALREMAGWFDFDVSRTSWWSYSGYRLRSLFTNSLISRRSPGRGTEVTYDATRSLYRNELPRLKYGGGFAKPMVDLVVDYMGVPSVGGDDADFLNTAISQYWAPALRRAFRDAVRDSKVVVRYYQQKMDNPLFTSKDKQYGCIEVYPPEQVALMFDPVDKNLLLQAVVTHWVDFDDSTPEQVANGEPPVMTTHQVVETITRQAYNFFDKTTGQPLESWRTPNPSGFVPLWPIWNEYADDLAGGISDYEPVMPFIEAFNEVMTQTLDAHEYHSIPKATFKVNNVEAFIRNNWPSAIDPETGQVADGATIDWRGREMIFLSPTEDAAFLEVTSVLGDSATLLDFLLGCICISSETPRFAFLANDQVPANTAEAEPFKKKIERKRVFFGEAIVMLCKMALVANGKKPNTPPLVWQPVNVEDLVSKGQAIEQMILGLDVAAAHGWIADATVVRILKNWFQEIGDPAKEMALAANNKQTDATQNPVNASQAIAPQTPALPATTGGATTNGKVGKSIATTKPSNS